MSDSGTDKRALISELKMKREPQLREGEAQEGPPRSAGLYRLLIPVAFGLAVAGLMLWFLLPSTAPTVDVAYARPVAAEPGGATLLEASGYVVARREATVSSKVTGRLTQLMIEEGQQVVAGQIIARLDASNAVAAVDQAAAQVSAAQASLGPAQIAEANSRSKLARVEDLHRSGWVSNQMLDDARAAYASARGNAEVARRQIVVARTGRAVTERGVDDTVVRAPFSGVVTVKAAQVGEIVSPISAGGGFTRTGIGTIVDMDSLEVEVDVAESYINRVTAGMPATVKLNAYPDWAIPAEVAAVIPTGDRSKATIKVRIRLQAQDRRIVPEMGAKVAFLSKPAEPASRPASGVEVPAAAIVADADGKFAVFVVGQDLRLERRVVGLGPARGDGRVVFAGIRPNERVVRATATKLKDGMTVRIKNQ